MPTEHEVAHAKPPFLKRVRIRNYKSIAFCDVTLEPLTILVGRNATGKSNFLDALGFLRDVVTQGAREAVHLHGGNAAVLHREAASPIVGLEVDMQIGELDDPQPMRVTFALDVEVPPDRAATIVRERLTSGESISSFRRGYCRHNGEVEWFDADPDHPPDGWNDDDRPYLNRLHGGEPFRSIRERLASVAAYNPVPALLRLPQLPSFNSFLRPDGANLASVYLATEQADPRAAARAARFLNAVAHAVQFAGVLKAGGYEILEFDTSENIDDWDGPLRKPMRFPGAAMSDGTLRAFACILAVYQTLPPEVAPSLVAIEEPETALHPAAMRAIVAAFDEATLRTQIIVTTHSPDLLDCEKVTPANVRVVQLIDGKTVIGPVDEVSVEIVRDELASLGRLEREGQLHADLDDLDRQAALAQGEPAHA